jgi:hypothetical protein
MVAVSVLRASTSFQAIGYCELRGCRGPRTRLTEPFGLRLVGSVQHRPGSDIRQRPNWEPRSSQKLLYGWPNGKQGRRRTRPTAILGLRNTRHHVAGLRRHSLAASGAPAAERRDAKVRPARKFSDRPGFQGLYLAGASYLLKRHHVCLSAIPSFARVRSSRARVGLLTRLTASATLFRRSSSAFPLGRHYQQPVGCLRSRDWQLIALASSRCRPFAWLVFGPRVDIVPSLCRAGGPHRLSPRWHQPSSSAANPQHLKSRAMRRCMQQTAPSGLVHAASCLMCGRMMSTEKAWALREASDKREQASYLRRAAEMLSLKDDRRLFLADAAALEAEADRMRDRPGKL